MKSLRGLVILGTALAWAGPAAAADPGDAGLGFGLALGYGHAMVMRDRQIGSDVAEPRFLAINPHLRLGLARLGAPDRWYHTKLEALLEGSVLVNFEPRDGLAGGASGVLRARLRPNARVSPYGEGGAGVTALDFGLQDQADGFAFLLLAGVGLRWQIAPGLALTSSGRWHHISNASLSVPNAGIDDLQVLLGFELR